MSGTLQLDPGPSSELSRALTKLRDQAYFRHLRRVYVVTGCVEVAAIYLPPGICQITRRRGNQASLVKLRFMPTRRCIVTGETGTRWLMISADVARLVDSSRSGNQLGDLVGCMTAQL